MPSRAMMRPRVTVVRYSLRRPRTSIAQVLMVHQATSEASTGRDGSHPPAGRCQTAQPPIHGDAIVAAFYAPWQETGLNSLHEYANHMTHLLPSWVHLLPNGKSLDFHDWDPAMVPHNNEVMQIARANNLNIVPVFSNAELSDFDPDRAHELLIDPVKQSAVIFQLRQWLLANRFQGINVDFENLNPKDYQLLIPFLQRIKTS